ncbi:MAG: hypothetical protein H7Y37_12390 [Anaerolineae bacterium]|nr:hypothetical protein [Gloeobacterales cyanobacterium ES-bin-313]
MTDSNNRLDRIEEILAMNATWFVETRQILTETTIKNAETAAIANSNARAIQAADSRIAEVADLVERNANANALLRDAVDALVHVADSTMARIDTVVIRIDAQSEQINEMSSEIRGLQTENRRILDRLERRDTES